MWYFGKDHGYLLPHPKNLSEARLANDELIYLAEEVSIQLNIGSVAWLLVVTPVPVCSEKEQMAHKEIQSVQFEEKKHQEI